MKSSYFENLTVSDSSFPVTAQVDFGFVTQGFSLLNLNNAETITYSFDGYGTHGDLVPGTNSTGLVFDHRYESSIWLKSANPALIRVEGWTNFGKQRA